MTIVNMKSPKKIFLGIVLLNLSGCGIFEWSGQYVNPSSNEYNENKSMFPYHGQEVEDRRKWNASRTKITSIKNEVINIKFPGPCTSFGFVGIITPFTPPIPFFWPSSFSCGNFEVMTEPNLMIILKHENKLYKPSSYNSEKHLYTFPLRAKSINSGSIIIEKDGEKIEVPFEYKYMKFWY